MYVRLSIHPFNHPSRVLWWLSGWEGGMDRRMNGRTDTQISPVFYRTSSLLRQNSTAFHSLDFSVFPTNGTDPWTDKQTKTCTDVEFNLKRIGTCLLYINQQLTAHPLSGLPGFCHTFGVMVSVLLTKSVKASVTLKGR